MSTFRDRGRTVAGEWISAALLAACAVRRASAVLYTSLAQVPMGCYNYGYVYTPEQPNITGMPFIEASAIMCQARCAGTFGCAYFGYWAHNQQCWLGGPGAVAVVSQTQGAVSGPANCATEVVACLDSTLPGPGFPGVTAEESRRAWVTGQQPTKLQCWPRKSNGFPATCVNQTATVLEDSKTGWPGRCEGMMRIENLEPSETCQSRCFGSPLCGVWAVENSSSSDGSLTCWQGMFGQNCYDSSNGIVVKPGAFFRAQRVMHGTFRMLMNTANMEIMNLTQAFGIQMHPNPQEGAKACRMTCLSYLLCEYWQYSDVYGCFVNDPLYANVAYPMVNNGKGMAIGTYRASTFKAGEFIQHTCKPGIPLPLPTDPPNGLGKHVVSSTHSPSIVPEYVDPSAHGDATRHTVAHQEDFPVWATMLIMVTIALCLSVIGAAVWMSMLDAEKSGSKRYGGGSRRNLPGSSSFDQVHPLVGHPPPTHHFGFGQWANQTYHNMHMPHFQHPGMMQPGMHPGMQPGYPAGPSHAELMQYAHRGY